MITRKALRASAKARQGQPNEFLKLVGEGEAAAAAGLPQSANPYTETDPDAADAWNFGWEG